MSVRRKHDRWIGSAQVFVDVSGWARAVLIHEGPERWLLIGPLGCVGEGVDEIKERRDKSEFKLKRLIEKELREAGY